MCKKDISFFFSPLFLKTLPDMQKEIYQMQQWNTDCREGDERLDVMETAVAHNCKVW